MNWKCWLLSLVAGLVAQAAMAQFVPPGSPNYDFQWKGNGPGCDYLFVGTFRFFIPAPRRGTEMLLDKTGDLVWFHQGGDYTLDFKVHPNGRITYNDRYHWYVLDSHFVVTDTVMCYNRITDFHELRIDANGHYFIICRDDSTMDLSAIHTRAGTPGSPAGSVRMVVLQELDANQNLVREWNGFDHYTIYDSDTTFFTNPGLLDHSHTNSIDLDGNGHLVVSHRHLDEVTLIDWATGDIRWQLGGKNNDFDLQGDAGFYGQHDARFLPNGQISLFDNGFQMARPLLVSLDTMTWTATLTEPFPDTVASRSMGSFQYLGDGSAVVGHGETPVSAAPGVTYYGANGGRVFDLDFGTDYHTYRAQCLNLPFALDRPQITCTEQSGNIILGVSDAHDRYLWTTGDTSATIIVTDTGRYQVYVPYGIGMISAPPVYIADLQNACASVGFAPSLVQAPRPRKLIGRYDLLGYPVLEPKPMQLVIERYSDGTAVKKLRIDD